MKGILLATFFLLSLHGVAGFGKLAGWLSECLKPGNGSFADTKPSTTSEHPIVFTFFESSNSNYSVPKEDAALIVNHTGFDPQKETCFLFHGFSQNIYSRMITELVPAMLKNCNVVVVDWSYYSCNNFFAASFYAITNSAGVASALKSMVDNGLNWKTVRFIGFSLGAEFIANSCKVLKNEGNQCPRILGLDPAGLIFNIPGPFSLIKGDAEFVTVIQSDRGVYGELFCLVDLCVRLGLNGHRFQPGCPCKIPFSQTIEDACSHIRSWETFKYATENPSTGLCRLCGAGFLGFIGELCNDNPIIDVGLLGNASDSYMI